MRVIVNPSLHSELVCTCHYIRRDMLDEDYLDFQQDDYPFPGAGSLLSMLSADLPFLHPESPTLHNEVRDCKLLCSLISVRGLPCSSSLWADSSGYSCTMRINDEQKDYKLSLQSSRDQLFSARLTGNDGSWECCDYFAQSRVSFAIRRKGWVSSKPILTASLSFQDLLRKQLARGGAEDRSWCFEDSLAVDLVQQTSRKASDNANWIGAKSFQSKLSKDFLPVQQPARTLCVTLRFQFRLIFLQKCLCNLPRSAGSCMSDLHVICAHGAGAVVADMLRALAAKGMLPGALALLTPEGHNALDLSLLHGNASTAMVLLQRAGRLCFHGSLIRDSRCLLHHAVLGGSTACFDALRRFLKKYGSASSTAEPWMHLQSLLDHHDGDGHTALTLACALAPRSQMVEFLLMAGAEIGSVNCKTGYTALMYAAEHGSTGMVATLLSVTRSDHELLANVSGSDEHTDDALSRHIRSNMHSRRLVLGREHGYEGLALTCYSALPAHRDARGRQALHIAAAHGHGAICSLLLRIGMSLASVDSSGDTVFHLLGSEGTDTSLVELLANAERERWVTFQAAVRPAGLDHMIRAAHPLLLLNHLGLTPSEVALLHGRIDLAAQLLDHAAAIYAADLTAFHRQRIAHVRRGIARCQAMPDLRGQGEAKRSEPMHMHGMHHEHKEEEDEEEKAEHPSSPSAAEEVRDDDMDYRFALAPVAHAAGAGWES